MKRKVTVHTKTGKKLVYYDADPDPKSDWMKYLTDSNTVFFGRFVIPKVNVDYVEIEER